jgi:hypothetical protein
VHIPHEDRQRDDRQSISVGLKERGVGTASRFGAAMRPR